MQSISQQYRLPCALANMFYPCCLILCFCVFYTTSDLFKSQLDLHQGGPKNWFHYVTQFLVTTGNWTGVKCWEYQCVLLLLLSGSDSFINLSSKEFNSFLYNHNVSVRRVSGKLKSSSEDVFKLDVTDLSAFLSKDQFQFVWLFHLHSTLSLNITFHLKTIARINCFAICPPKYTIFKLHFLQITFYNPVCSHGNFKK